MTKRRTTTKQRARELQRAPGARLAYGQALESARRKPGPDQARAALRDLAECDGLSLTWRERILHHLEAASREDWPGPVHAAELREDLHLLAGAITPSHDRPVVPTTFEHFPLAFLHKATSESREAFTTAALCALGGSLRHLLRHPYGQPPRGDDVVYRFRAARTTAPRRRLTVENVDGLHFQDVFYPRPWGAADVGGFYRSDTVGGRREVARAVLAEALGGTAPSSLAACRACHGTGWLTALDGGHTEHAPAYRSHEGPVCACAGCRGTGLRPLPVAEFDESFGHRLESAGPGAGVTRSEILGWAAARLPDGPGGPAGCGEELQSGYAKAVVGALREAGFTVGAGEEPCGLDFDVDGGLSAYFHASGEAVERKFGRERVLVLWSNDRGWSVTGFGRHHRLLHGEFVPAPEDLARALSEGGHAVDEGEERAALPQQDADVYTAVLSYPAPTTG
ncbi:DUF6292 family protein [Streptomyces anulatus]|uniref:DUF6292 family protein n=1 Tax=Streptomyces anulatus TaxID=1892 RepID=UPI001C26EA47|nr:DUF6292 family protein [Streptomyces anulatus]